MTVNRLWHQIFGTGLVKTVEDFGVQGEFPSHPELLDYLACEFRDGDLGRGRAWSTKHCLRLIVTSADLSPGVDGSRRPRELKTPIIDCSGAFRASDLNAEEIRDQALFAAGLLSTRLGGPPVFPYQPPACGRNGPTRPAIPRFTSAVRASRSIAAASIHSGSEPAHPL